MTWLARNRTDSLRIVAALSGLKHRPTLSESLQACSFLVLFGVVTPALIVLALLHDQASPWYSWQSIVLAGLAMVSPALGLAAFSALKATVAIDEEVIVSKAPLFFDSWRLQTSQIHSVLLCFHRGQCFLDLSTADGSVRRLQLYPEHLERLSGLFPSLGRPGGPLLLIGWMRIAAYTMLALMVAAFILLIVWS